jgi:hypothetical protein
VKGRTARLRETAELHGGIRLAIDHRRKKANHAEAGLHITRHLKDELPSNFAGFETTFFQEGYHLRASIAERLEPPANPFQHHETKA